MNRLLRVRINVSDLARLADFYCEALGFVVVQTAERGVRLRLGAQTLELVQPEVPGAPYPADSRATDVWFQHVALVVSDMAAAYAHLCRHAMTPITIGGPQRLPPSTGRVQAFKFRDPDGHPLELLAFPPGAGDAHWQSGDALFLGYDHSALVVSDVTRSIAFYEALGLVVAGRTLNHGPEQERLDDAPGVRVDVVALRAAAEATPHVELLGYQVPPVTPLPGPLAPSDIASSRLVFESDRAAELHDPDGHAIVLVQSPLTQSPAGYASR
jgi:catechol 2,3-dioxygenase-like lactoylglutathione lyase family enzyme